MQLDQVRSKRLSRRTLLALAIPIVIGVALGWMMVFVWPAENKHQADDYWSTLLANKDLTLLTDKSCLAPSRVRRPISISQEVLRIRRSVVQSEVTFKDGSIQTYVLERGYGGYCLKDTIFGNAVVPDPRNCRDCPIIYGEP